MKKVLILTLAISLVIAGIALATVVSSKHDMRPSSSPLGAKAVGATTSQVCVFCHHPHRGTSNISTALLWNISDALQTYPTYGPTATTNSSNIGSNLDTASGAAMYSLLCMGCHDGGGTANSFIRGTVDGTLGSFPNIGVSAANLGSSLEDDHPVDFTYPSTLGLGDDIMPTVDAGKTVVGNISSTKYPLYTGTMQCATCHDVHNGDSKGVQFMRGDDIIVNSKICRDCHTAK